MAAASSHRELERDDVRLGTLDVINGGFGFYTGTCTLRSGSQKSRSGGKTDLISVSIKVLSKKATPKERRHFEQELAVMSQFDHPNILGLWGAVTRSEPLMMVVDYAEAWSLDQHLQHQAVDIGLLRKFALDVCNGLIYLERSGYVHWDIACRNITLNFELRCQITNFGLIKEPSDNAPAGYYHNPSGQRMMRWSAPEVADIEGNLRRPTHQEDVWCYGLFLYELMTAAKIPYGPETWISEDMYTETMIEVQNGAVLPPPDGCPDDIYDIIVDCSELSPEHRPSFQRIKQWLSTQKAIDELDAVLTTATEQAIQQGLAASNVHLSPAAARGSEEPSSPLDDQTQHLVRENAELRAELEAMRKTLQDALSKGELPASAAETPKSPRPARKFRREDSGEIQAGTLGRCKTPVNEKVQARFTQIFTEPTSPPKK